MLAPGSDNELQSGQSLTESIPARCCISCLHEDAMPQKEPRTIACPGSTKQLLPVLMSENRGRWPNPTAALGSLPALPGTRLGIPRVQGQGLCDADVLQECTTPVLGLPSGIRERRASLPVLRTRNITVPVFSSRPFFFPARDPRETQKDLIIQAQRSPRNQGFSQRLLVPN